MMSAVFIVAFASFTFARLLFLCYISINWFWWDFMQCKTMSTSSVNLQYSNFRLFRLCFDIHFHWKISFLTIVSKNSFFFGAQRISRFLVYELHYFALLWIWISYTRAKTFKSTKDSVLTTQNESHLEWIGKNTQSIYSPTVHAKWTHTLKECEWARMCVCVCWV